MVFKEWFKIRDEKRISEFLQNKDDKTKALQGLRGALNFFDQRHTEKLRIVLYGGCSSILIKTIFAPIERLKIELQTCRHLKRSVRLQTSSTEIITYALIGTSTASMDVHTLVRKRGLSGYIKHVIENEGFSALFRGNGLNVLRVIPTSFMKFAFFDIYRHLSSFIFSCTPFLCAIPQSEKDFLLIFSSALMSGFNLTMFAYPLDLLRTRLTVVPYYSKYHFKANWYPYMGTSIRCLRELIRNEGIFALWKGMGTSLVGVIPYVTCSLSFYEYLKSTIHKKFEETYGTIEKGSTLDLGLKLCYGTVSAFIGKTISYPADTIRRRRQLLGCMPSMHSAAVIPHGDIVNSSIPTRSLIKLEADEYTSGISRYGTNGIKVNEAVSNSHLEPLFTQDGRPMYRNTFHAFSRIVREEGFRALFNGWKLNIFKVVPGMALHFVIYEQFKNIFGYDKAVLTDDQDVDDDEDDL
ncbi:hypothetical protein C9374_006445 [Naegleria lovaniensis]|uniref:Mitochondrial carrier protein n=1 Tax=Naegleria lovaniensis TaxID=51637 RepID=A0AA88KMH2_NAELO|nr:uncharacterized protein C9374_006445 [Naegleria lovaniensis]KAG2381456.1 hypothetical protein C9374_006445 [Naegleria lovaniensis]